MSHSPRNGARSVVSLGASITLSVSVLVLAPTGPALASRTPTLSSQIASSDAKLLPSPKSGRPGERIKLVGVKFDPAEYVIISFVDSVRGKTFLSTFSTDPDGVCTGSVTIPADATVGRQKITARATSSHEKAAVRFRVL